MAEQKLRQKLTDITLTEIVTDTGCDRFSEGNPEESKSPRAYGVYLVSGSICECTILVPETLTINCTGASESADMPCNSMNGSLNDLQNGTQNTLCKDKGELCGGIVSIEGRCTKKLTLTASAHQVDMISQDGLGRKKADIIFPGIVFPATEAGKREKVSGEIYAVWKDGAPAGGTWSGNVSYDVLVEPKGAGGQNV